MTSAAEVRKAAGAVIGHALTEAVEQAYQAGYEAAIADGAAYAEVAAMLRKPLRFLSDDQRYQAAAAAAELAGKGLSQRQVASRLGISQATVSRLLAAIRRAS